jgi:hypothetical protein
MTMAMVTSVKLLGVTGKEPPHQSGNWHRSRFQEQMDMLCEAVDYVKL